MCDLGHKCKKLCFEECGHCLVMVTRNLPCGHQVKLQCYIDYEKVFCKVSSIIILLESLIIMYEPCQPQFSKLLAMFASTMLRSDIFVRLLQFPSSIVTCLSLCLLESSDCLLVLVTIFMVTVNQIRVQFVIYTHKLRERKVKTLTRN